MRILVTGGCGFIGANFVKYFLRKYPDYKIVNIDLLTYAGNLENLTDIESNPNYKFVRGDIADSKVMDQVFQEKIDAVVNFAAESHVDRSLYDPGSFVRTNIVGVQVLLDAALKRKVRLFLQISTDEVYGSVTNQKGFTESSPLNPSSPYSASKASADLLALSYFKTFNAPVIITRGTNNFGPYQFPEKLIPLFITNAMEDKQLPLYGDGMHIRDWLFVEDHCSALDLALHKGKAGEVYNISAHNEKPNKEITYLILKNLNRPESLIKQVPDRPAHDRHYALDSTKIERELDWKPKYSFEEGMKLTIDWYKKNCSWWENIKSGEYLKYYQKHYSSLSG
jgi:dTDP-glucose 4,6-dehydratase